MGLTQRNLNALLSTTDDFELHILDSNSKDNTWELLQSFKDPRIASITKLDVNAGPIYAVNYNLKKRRPGQYFIALDSDVCIKTPDWISCFMKVFQTFPEAGLLGVPRSTPYPEYLPQVIPMERDGVSYLQLKEGKVGVPLDFIPGHCQCLRPELIDMIGYWSEESYYGDAELSVRVNNYTPYRAGLVNNISIDMVQFIPCEECGAKGYCRLDRGENTCFSIRNRMYKNESFAETFKWKYIEYFRELEQGKRSVYCASIHDPDSIRNHIYKMQWAQENFNFYISNAN